MVNRFSILNLVNEENINGLLIDLSKQGYKVMEIDGRDIFDSKTFFNEVKDTLPFDPPIGRMVNWDAFSDSLWEGICNLGSEKVAIVWTEVHNMLKYGLLDLIKSVQCLTDVATSLYNDTDEVERVSLILFLVGEGSNFPVYK